MTEALHCYGCNVPRICEGIVIPPRTEAEGALRRLKEDGAIDWWLCQTFGIEHAACSGDCGNVVCRAVAALNAAGGGA